MKSGFLAAFALIALGIFGTPAEVAKAKAEILSEGLQIWRKPGAIQGHAACATCHSPDGIEIAAYNFSDADITRRALPHVSAQDADILVGYIHALRQKFGFKKLRDPMKDRPLQPGGDVLPGNTAEARDLAFGLELSKQLPKLFGPPPATYEQAKAAEIELLNLDLNQLKIGIPLNRLSEDISHGPDHASIDEWLPEIPPIVPEAKIQEWYEAEDEYLKNPTAESLHKLLVRHFQSVNTSRQLPLPVISAMKFRALLVWQDRLRNHTEADPVHLSHDISTPGGFNALWAVGDTSRLLVNQVASSIGMDTELQSKKIGAIPLNEQLHQLRLSWFWVGWLSDQGLFKTSRSDTTRLGIWLSQSLIEDGPYYIHNVFANARRQAVVSNDVESWGETPERRRRIWDFASIRPSQHVVGTSQADPTYHRLYVTFLSNCYWMNLWLLKHDIETTGTVWIKISTKSNVKEMIRFIKTNEPDQARSAERIEQVLDELIDGAKERY